MKNFLKCIIICLVSGGVVSDPVSQPVYQNTQYVTAQAVPANFKQPQALGYVQQYARPQTAPVYESRIRAEGLQSYASQGQQVPNFEVQNVPNQRVLVASNIESQAPKVPQYSTPQYVSQVQLASQAQEAFAAAQRKAAAQNYNKPVQPAVAEQPQQQYLQPQYYQPPQYLKEQTQPQVRYVSRPAATPAPIQYKFSNKNQQSVQERDEEKEEYDPNPSYQFGFDVKDDLYTNYQNRKEQREGNKITGSYSVVDSDGYIRTVSYTADPKEGFKAEVSRQPTDIVVKIPKPDPQFQNVPRQQVQYVQQVPQQHQRGHQQQDEQKQSNLVYQYQ